MPQHGMIHEKLDIKILILFILRRLPGVVEPETLLDLVQCDAGVGYFDYSDCLAELVATGHIDEVDGGYRITEKGARNADTVESSLPYSVRMKAERVLAPVAERIARDAMIVTEHFMTDSGLTAHLAMSDGRGGDHRHAPAHRKRGTGKAHREELRRSAESIYQQIIALVSEEERKDKK